MKPASPIRAFLGRMASIIAPRYPLVRQYEQSDCGAAALLSVLKCFGGDCPLPIIRDLTHTDRSGTSLLNLVEAANALGLNAHGARGTYEELTREKLPCIAHWVTKQKLNHFVVVYEATPNRAVIGDPAEGVTRLSPKAFCEAWASNAVMLVEGSAQVFLRAEPHWIPSIWRYFRKENVLLYQSLFLGLLYAGAGIAVSLIVQTFVDNFIPRRDMSGVLISGGVLLAIQIFRGSIGYARQRFLLTVNRRVSIEATSDFLGHIFKLPLTFFESRRIGDLTTRLADLTRIQQAMLRLFGGTVIDAITVVGVVSAVFVISGWLGMIASLAMPVYAAILFYSTQRLRERQAEVSSAFADVQSSYVDVLQGIHEITGFGVGDVFAEGNRGLYRVYQERNESLGRVQAMASTLGEIIGGLVLVTALVVAVYLVLRHKLTLGQMLAAYSLIALALPSIARLVEANSVFQIASIAAIRLTDLMLISEEPNPGSEQAAQFRILEARNLEFTWPRTRTPVLRDVTLAVPSGRITALTGASGTGKSTLVRLLERKYQPTQGKVLFNDRDASLFALGSYRSMIAVVPDRVKIFNATIADNVVLGRGPAASRQVSDWVDELGLGAFLSRFGSGDRTWLGEDGWRLSSGESQIIGLLRALWGRPGILVIDEGISAIDSDMEKRVFRGLREYSRQNAVLLISHRLEQLNQADYVYVLSDGRVETEGTPSECIGPYVTT